MNVPEEQFGNDEARWKRKCMEIELNWTKKSFFLDVMHVEKNICDSVLGTLLYDSGKTKNTPKAWMDLEDFFFFFFLESDLEDISIRNEFHLQKTNTSTKMSQAKYTLTKAENTRFCD